MYLTIQCGRIMSSPEHIKQSLIATFFGIILDPDNLWVVCGPRTYILIAWIMQKTLAITNLRLGRPRHPLEGQLDTPKTASTKLGKLLTRCWCVIIWSLSNGWTHILCCPWATKPESVQQVHGVLVDSNMWMSFGGEATTLDRKSRKWWNWKELRFWRTRERRRKEHQNWTRQWCCCFLLQVSRIGVK